MTYGVRFDFKLFASTGMSGGLFSTSATIDLCMTFLWDDTEVGGASARRLARYVLSCSRVLSCLLYGLSKAAYLPERGGMADPLGFQPSLDCHHATVHFLRLTVCVAVLRRGSAHLRRLLSL